MLFNSTPFLFAFLPVSLLVFRLLFRHAPGWMVVLWLSLSSIFFYAQFIPLHLALFATSIAVNFTLGRRLADHPSRAVLAGGIVFNLGVLCVFKYTGFAIANLNALTGLAIPDPGIVLPLALSFFTFQKIGYIIDVYRGGAPRYRFNDFLLFVMFFPQLLAGPIVHHATVMPQIANLGGKRWADPAGDLAIGLTFFCIGLFKKLGIADSVAPYGDFVFSGDAAAPDMLTAWIGAIAYTLQIYFDFSGYSDMAVGLGRMFGIRLPQNFLSPYRATSIIEFWRRWHVTLSAFLRDYLYLPLGGNRRGRFRRYANLWIVMLLGGLWHGAAWTFVAWGALHGLYLSVNHAWHAVRGRDSRPGRVERLAGWLLTMVAVVVAWVFFRAPDFAAAGKVLLGMAGRNGIILPGAAAPFIDALPRLKAALDITTGGANHLATLGGGPAMLLSLPAAMIIALACPTAHQWLEDGAWRFGSHRFPLLAWHPTAAWAMALFALAAGSLAWQVNTVRFLYFQF